MAFTNSSLVEYTLISPNKNSPRNHIIDTITPHCVVGQASAVSVCQMFNRTSARASCNYVIGKDGEVAMCVEEKDRSWCSSNGQNDHRAITIECASDRTPPYKMNNKVIDTLIKLCADICKRNGMVKLMWKADKTLIGKVDEQNVTVHRWFANKSCPGDYLYNMLGDVVRQVNVLMGIKDTEAKTPENNKFPIAGKVTERVSAYSIRTGFFADPGVYTVVDIDEELQMAKLKSGLYIPLKDIQLKDGVRLD